MSSEPQRKLTEAEYLEIERRSEVKHELVDGRMVAMAGASLAHVLLVTNLVGALGDQLKPREHTVCGSNLRVKIQKSGRFTYPDVAVVCERLELGTEQRDVLLNPRVLIEVLSDSTQAYDRGEKFEQYRSIPSFTEYLLIAQDRHHIEHYVRQKDGRWLLEETDSLGDSVVLESINCRLALADIYAKVRFAEEGQAR
jgi:Uma2 family endonuclease